MGGRRIEATFDDPTHFLERRFEGFNLSQIVWVGFRVPCRGHEPPSAGRREEGRGLLQLVRTEVAGIGFGHQRLDIGAQIPEHPHHLLDDRLLHEAGPLRIVGILPCRLGIFGLAFPNPLGDGLPHQRFHRVGRPHRGKQASRRCEPLLFLGGRLPGRNLCRRRLSDGDRRPAGERRCGGDPVHHLLLP
jgi:hypothetical protein